MNFKIEIQNRTWADELKFLVQEFIVDTYFQNEWNGQPLSVMDIGNLFGIHKNNIIMVIANIKEKIRKEYPHLLDADVTNG